MIHTNSESISISKYNGKQNPDESNIKYQHTNTYQNK